MEHQEVFFLWCTKADLLDEHDRPRLKASERHLAKRLPYLKHASGSIYPQKSGGALTPLVINGTDLRRIRDLNS